MLGFKMNEYNGRKKGKRCLENKKMVRRNLFARIEKWKGVENKMNRDEQR